MIRARIEYEPLLDGCRLLMINRGEGLTVVRQWDERQTEVVRTTPGVAVETDRTGFLHFSDEELRAIYAAIGAYFGLQPQDASLLRQDYVAERGRVDKLANAIIKIAGGES